MKQSYLKRIVLAFFLAPQLFFAQTLEQVKQIKEETNTVKLKQIANQLLLKSQQEKTAAWAKADQMGWRKTYVDQDGSYRELVKLTDKGAPIYFKTDNLSSTKSMAAFRSNATAARATRANWLHNGGGLGLNIEGQGMTAYVWDGGLARVTHQEYDGIGGDNRFSQGDNGALNFHGAHVLGTIISSGFVATAKGMAPQGRGIGYNWTSDESEAATASANGMLLSNHSYGYGANDIPDQWFGAYRGEAREWDGIMYNAPYYLQVISAGNDGNNNTANAQPLNNQPFFDKLSGFKTSKNSMIVANAQDPSIDDSDGSLLSVLINSSSSEGPTDDLRIKPDITGNGTGLFSTYQSADDAYNTLSGTSMSAPNVTGSLLLLQQYYNQVNGKFMRAATLKGLALHTADDAGLNGPDATYGWGLMNTKRAAETITAQGLNSMIVEGTISQGETITYTVKSDETNPLYASISWTDLPGTVNNTVNSSTPALVNDLDIRVSNDSETFSPWRLTNVNSNGKGDNIVDPFERVDVDGASGTYTITITHKGTLADGPQNFSLIVTGMQSDFTFNADNPTQTVCSDADATYDLSYTQVASGTTNFTVQNLPSGATASFSQASLSATGSTTLTLSDLENVAAGEYQIDIVGDNGNETETKTITLTVYHPTFENNPMSLAFPSNEEKGLVFPDLTLQWNANANATSYEIQLSKSPAFTDLLVSETKSELEHAVSGLEINTVYYWRVKPANSCGTGDFSEIYSFQTAGSEDCSNTYAATNFSGAQIFLNGNNTASVPIDIGDDLTISRLIVSAELTHTRVSDLTLYIQEPAELGSNNVILAQNVCGDGQDVNAVWDDTGNALACAEVGQAINGTIIPTQSLAFSAGKSSSGRWFFAAWDNVFLEGGSIDAASITVCTALPNTNVPNFTNNNVDIIANGSYTFKNTDILASTDSETAADQVYTLVLLPTKGNLEKNGVVLGLGDTFTQAEVDGGLIAFDNNQTELFSDSFKVDISNAANGWLPNQTINMTATTLSNQAFEIDGLNVYPNPNFGDLNIQLNPRTQASIQVAIFDLQGRSVLRKTFDNTSLRFNETLNVRSLSNGVYLLNIREGSYTSTKRIVISK